MKNLKKNPTFCVFGSLIVILLFLGVFTFSSCSEYGLSPTEQTSLEPPLDGQIDFLMYNGGGFDPTSITHTVEINKPIWFRARTSNSNIHYFTWNMGNNDTTSGKEFIYSYHAPGTYTVCVTGWTQDSHYVFCDQLNVEISISGANPVLQLQSATPVAGGRYKLTLLFRKKSVTDYTNCGISAPFATYNAGIDSTAWIIHSNLRDSIAGYFRDTVTVPNYYLLKMAFGGSPGCYANMQPTANPPQTSAYWHNDPEPSRRGLWAKVVNGNLVPFDTVISLPGTVGDGLQNPIIRLGISPTSPDTVVMYCNSNYNTSTSGTHQWANNVTGMNVGIPLVDAYGYTGWKMGRLHKNQVLALLNQYLEFKYGRPISNLASYQNSIFHDPNSGSPGILGVFIVDIGDGMNPKPVMQIKNKITGEVLGELVL